MEDVICKKCGLVNDYEIIVKSGQQTAWCNGCSGYLKNIPYEAEAKMYFGKYAQAKISEINDLGYLEWAIDNIKKLNPKQIEAITKQIYKLK